MKYCGIDPSTSSTGISILNNKNLILYECIKPKSKNWRERIEIQAREIDRILSNNKVDCVIIEDVPLKDGKPTLVKLGAVHGSILSICSLHNIPVIVLKVNEWRQMAGFFDGNRENETRDAMKQKAIKEVKEIFDIEVNDDIAESILIGYRYNYPVEK